jgi:hypothetical protein
MAIVEKPAFTHERVTLKNIKINQSLSEETTCYSATVYLDGKRVGTTGNRGHGGSDEIRVDREIYDILVEIAKEAGCGDFEPVDMLFSKLLDAHETAKGAKKYAKKGLPVYMFVDIDGYNAMEYGLRSRAQVAEALAAVEAKYPDARSYTVIGEDMPKVEHPTLTAAVAALVASGQRTSIATSKDGKTLSFAVNGTEHVYTDEQHTDEDESLYDQFVGEHRRQQQAKRNDALERLQARAAEIRAANA